jgi:hypothetical protein
MKVVAVELGFYDGRKRRIGDGFDLDTSTLRKDMGGNPILPAWVTPDSAAARADAVAAAKAAEVKDFEAIVASAGPKRPGVKAVSQVGAGMAQQNDGLL